MIRRASAGNIPEPHWYKSSYSSGNEGDSCVEVATTPGVVHVRDSKNTAGPQLAFAGSAWTQFVTYATQGEPLVSQAARCPML